MLTDDPSAGLTPTSLHFGNAEEAMTSLTTQLRTIPLQQVMRGATDASWHRERGLVAGGGITLQQVAA